MSLKTYLFAALLLPSIYAFSQDKIVYIYSADSINRGIEFNDQGKYKEAIALYNMVAPGDSNYEWAVYEKCLSLTNDSQYTAAINTAELGLSFKNASEGHFYNLLGTCYDNMGQQQKAIDLYNKAIERFPMDYNLFFNRALVYEKMDQPKLMLTDLERAVELNPFHASSHLKLAYTALNEEQYAQALLALGYFMMLEPKSERTNPTLVYFNNAVSDKVDLKSKNLTLENEDDFRKINLLLTSYAALRKDYKYDSDIDIPLIRQMHMVYDQASKIKKRKGFWENYYLPLFSQLMEKGYFEPFSYFCLLTSGNERHQKIITKNSKDIKEMVAWAGPKIKEIHALHHLHYDENNEQIKYWFFDSGQAVQAAGKVKNDQPVGDYTFYYSNGSVSSVGSFDENGKRTGPWEFYHANGSISNQSSYKEGNKTGKDLDYYENGKLYIEAKRENDLLNGLVNVYNKPGDLDRSMFQKDGKIEDSLVYYYSNGTKAAYLPMKGGQVEGEASYYRADGSLSSTITFANDQRNGPFIAYFPDHNISSKGTYKNGKYDGTYISYYPNDTVEEMGNYVEGTKVGQWKEFFYDGKIRSIANYDEKGKSNGHQEYYDYNGHKTNSFEFNKGEVTQYQYYTKDGSVLHEDKRKHGSFWLEGYTLEGVKNVEGNYEGDHKEGKWKYYTDNGLLASEETYNEKGELDGEYIRYYPGGQVRQRRMFKRDTLNGYEVSYYPNGQMQEQGYNWKGKANGVWRNYEMNGNLDYINFYVKGNLNGPQYYYDPAGKLVVIKQFHNGLLTSVESCDGDSTAYKIQKIETPNGKEVRYYPNGQLLYELSIAGEEYDGPAHWYHGTGAKSTEGQYLNGERHGDWVWYYPDGKVETRGHYSFGNKSGLWEGYYKNGKKSYSAHYENGELQGDYFSYYDNGKLDYKVTYFQGEMNGKRYFHDYNGNIDHIRYYDQGRIVGYSYLDKDGKEIAMIPLAKETGAVVSYFPNGQVSRKYELKNGMLEGNYQEFNQDGSPRYKVAFKNDLKEGKQQDFYGNGKPKAVKNYVHDELNGEAIYYYANGKVKRKENYLNDSLHGPVEEYDENGKLTNKYEYDGGYLYEKI